MEVVKCMRELLLWGSCLLISQSGKHCLQLAPKKKLERQGSLKQSHNEHLLCLPPTNSRRPVVAWWQRLVPSLISHRHYHHPIGSSLVGTCYWLVSHLNYHFLYKKKFASSNLKCEPRQTEVTSSCHPSTPPRHVTEISFEGRSQVVFACAHCDARQHSVGEEKDIVNSYNGAPFKGMCNRHVWYADMITPTNSA